MIPKIINMMLRFQDLASTRIQVYPNQEFYQQIVDIYF